MEGKLSGKTALITGASRGIGAGIAEAYARHGARLVLVARSETVEKTARRFAERGIEAIGIPADVATYDDMKKVAALAIETFGTIDIVCANAGICEPEPFTSATANTALRRHLDVNVIGTWNTIRTTIEYMIEQGSGKIVIVSSVTGDMVADPGETAYATSKAALIGLTKSLAREMAAYGITVNAICPGIIYTEMIDGLVASSDSDNVDEALNAMAAAIPLKRMGTPREVGELAAFLSCDAESSYLTGGRFVIDGGSTLPESAAFAV